MTGFDGWLSVLSLLVLVASPLSALDVDVELHGRYDRAAYETWAWRLGTPAGGRVVEQIIHATIEEEMERDGLELVEGEADCYLYTFVIRDTKYPAGVLKVDIVDGETEELAWRGMAYGVVDTGNQKKIEKMFRKVVRRMFRKFPEAIPD